MLCPGQVYRIEYDAHRQLLQITFEFGLTAHAQRFPSMATFACLLMPVAQPEWGFRSGLDAYFSLHPAVYLLRSSKLSSQTHQFTPVFWFI